MMETSYLRIRGTAYTTGEVHTANCLENRLFFFFELMLDIPIKKFLVFCETR